MSQGALRKPRRVFPLPDSSPVFQIRGHQSAAQVLARPFGVRPRKTCPSNGIYTKRHPTTLGKLLSSVARLFVQPYEHHKMATMHYNPTLPKNPPDLNGLNATHQTFIMEVKYEEPIRFHHTPPWRCHNHETPNQLNPPANHHQQLYQPPKIHCKLAQSQIRGDPKIAKARARTLDALGKSPIGVLLQWRLGVHPDMLKSNCSIYTCISQLGERVRVPTSFWATCDEDLSSSQTKSPIEIASYEKT